jgi:hypothetical protein
MLLILGNDLYNQLWFSPGTAVESGVKQGSKLMDAKMLNASVFFILHLKIVTETTKNACAYIFQQV